MTNVIDKWPIAGVLLYKKQKSEIANLLLKFFQLKSALSDIKGIEGEESIASIVPTHLRENEDIWLCLFLTDQPNEVLVVPLNCIKNSNSQLLDSELNYDLKNIRGKITQPWTPLSGYNNYTFSSRNKGLTPRAQVICLSRSITEINFFHDVYVKKENQKAVDDSIKIFFGGTEKTQRWREELLSKALENLGDLQFERAIEEFEEKLLNEN
ncbi:MAG: hypothetical protein A4E52_00733 [Pelotomaculum sp. PtaB.Bin013]|uniref:Uncharacterized protein n=1 Tax=Pelotomaculum isophthalicicum JI TaxID=947010 RepID=A0A9X4H4P6_9FIRM|nr:hypothetical protein [Pelotomaculum isophthalicicum]MDF9407742.1 hypothetical protein [Pelotomaculum isophthalicicum JI]OPX90755.1 MAG: hypothetical protein A4E52_00733 [Pelotomaculum sp. PtaB.Bin013]